MRLARVLGAIGRGLISAGVVVLLFVAYQLWGTGIQNGQAQDGLENEFEAIVGGPVADDPAALEAAFEASQDSIESGDVIPDEGGDGGLNSVGEEGADLVGVDFESPEFEEFLARIYPEAGEPLARLLIPDINVDQIVIEGVSTEDLRKGPGHYPSTPNPGQAGNASIAGHRTTYGAPFHRIDELNPGDEIFVTTAQGTFKYRVKAQTASDGTQVGHLIVSPSDVWVLGQESGENLLTLTACHPKYSARQRIIVQAELVGQPAPTIEPADAENQSPVTIAAEAPDADENEATGGGELAAPSQAETPDLDSVVSDDVARDDDPTLGGAEAGDTNGPDGAADSAEGDDSNTQSDVVDLDVEELVTDDDATEAALLDQQEQEADAADDSDAAGATNFGEGLDGDRTRVQPAILWGAAAMMIWTTAGFVGRRVNHRVLLYVVGLVPFAVVLWSAFVNVDQALPSY